MKQRNYKYSRLLFGLVALVFLKAADISARELGLPSQLPLGMAHDGRTLWVGDTRTSKLYGYDFKEERKVAEKRIKLPQLRDFAFRHPHLISVAPNYFYFINPINGDVVERQYGQEIDDPVSIALDQNLAYIYNRSDQRMYRYQLDKRKFLGSYKLSIGDIRGAVYHKNHLWVVDRKGRVHKLEPGTGERKSFVPVPDNTYGISFVDGQMYVAQPNKVRTVDFVETDTYVAASERKVRLRATLAINAPWPEPQRKKEPELKLSFKSIPFGPHQRYRKLQAKPQEFRFARREEGEALVRKSFDKNEKQAIYEVKGEFTTFDLTHIVTEENAKKYFNSSELPKHILRYVNTASLPAEARQAIAPMVKRWKNQNDGRHPYAMLPFLYENGVRDREEQQVFLRELGVASREAVVYNTKKNERQRLLQLYLVPFGWVTITDAYDPENPREFPIGNHIIVLYFPASLKITPEVKAPKTGETYTPPTPLVRWQDIEVAEVEAEE